MLLLTRPASSGATIARRKCDGGRRAGEGFGFVLAFRKSGIVCHYFGLGFVLGQFLCDFVFSQFAFTDFVFSQF